MSKNTASTRRSFLKRGALLAAPLAAGAPSTLLADDGLKARLARLEDQAAIRALHQTWLREVNARAADVPALRFADPEVNALGHAVRSIVADHAGPADSIEIAADGKNAAGRFLCAVEIETKIAQDCTLARMAHAQGGGFVRRTEHRLLKVDYVKSSGAWAIVKVQFSSVSPFPGKMRRQT